MIKTQKIMLLLVTIILLITTTQSAASTLTLAASPNFVYFKTGTATDVIVKLSIGTTCKTSLSGVIAAMGYDMFNPDPLSKYKDSTSDGETTKITTTTADEQYDADITMVAKDLAVGVWKITVTDTCTNDGEDAVANKDVTVTVLLDTSIWTSDPTITPAKFDYEGTTMDAVITTVNSCQGTLTVVTDVTDGAGKAVGTQFDNMNDGETASGTPPAYTHVSTRTMTVAELVDTTFKYTITAGCQPTGGVKIELVKTVDIVSLKVTATNKGDATPQKVELPFTALTVSAPTSLTYDGITGLKVKLTTKTTCDGTLSLDLTYKDTTGTAITSGTQDISKGTATGTIPAQTHVFEEFEFTKGVLKDGTLTVEVIALCKPKDGSADVTNTQIVSIVSKAKVVEKSSSIIQQFSFVILLVAFLII